MQTLPDTLHEKIERHLLLAQLTPEQRHSARRHGWFELPWREQWLVLRVHLHRTPTVEAFQPGPHVWRPEADPAELSESAVLGMLDEPGAARPSIAQAVQLTRLCAWDVAGAFETAAAAIRFVSLSDSRVGLARLVLEAHRRGALVSLLEAATRLDP